MAAEKRAGISNPVKNRVLESFSFSVEGYLTGDLYCFVLNLNFIVDPMKSNRKR